MVKWYHSVYLFFNKINELETFLSKHYYDMLVLFDSIDLHEMHRNPHKWTQHVAQIPIKSDPGDDDKVERAANGFSQRHRSVFEARRGRKCPHPSDLTGSATFLMLIHLLAQMESLTAEVLKRWAASRKSFNQAADLCLRSFCRLHSPFR